MSRSWSAARSATTLRTTALLGQKEHRQVRNLVDLRQARPPRTQGNLESLLECWRVEYRRTLPDEGVDESPRLARLRSLLVVGPYARGRRRVEHVAPALRRERLPYVRVVWHVHHAQPAQQKLLSVKFRYGQGSGRRRRRLPSVTDGTRRRPRRWRRATRVEDGLGPICGGRTLVEFDQVGRRDQSIPTWVANAIVVHARCVRDEYARAEQAKPGVTGSTTRGGGIILLHVYTDIAQYAKRRETRKMGETL